MSWCTEDKGPILATVIWGNTMERLGFKFELSGKAERSHSVSDLEGV